MSVVHQMFPADSQIMSSVVFTERIPDILTKVIDSLNKRASFHEEKNEEKMKDDIMSIMSQVVKLRNHVMKAKTFEQISDDEIDNFAWNYDINHVKTSEEGAEKSWFNCPLLFSECYYYRKLYEIFAKSALHKEFDYFMIFKSKSTREAEPFIKIAAKHFKSIFDDMEPIKENFTNLLLFSTFSNQIDLSLMNGNTDLNLKDFDLDSYVGDLLNDDCEKAFDYVSNLSHGTERKFHFVIDNAGLEFVCDICFAMYLLRTNSASCIIFHVKKFPWFVSDVTLNDVDFLINYLLNSHDENMIFIADLLQTYIKTGLIKFEADYSWNFSNYYSELVSLWAIFNNLFSEFSKSSLVVFKGDLNFRRLCGEFNWGLARPMKETLKRFDEIPILIMRTVKSVSVCNLDQDAIKSVSMMPEDWFMAGDKAQIIFVNKND